jgi:hypothetical protein
MSRVSTPAEDAAVRALSNGSVLHLPTPDEETTAFLVEKGAVSLGKVDRVLSAFRVPQDWKLTPSPSDSRQNKLMDGEGKTLVSVFLKRTDYDYYGRTSRM